MPFVQMFAYNADIAKELKERIAILAEDGISPKFRPSTYQQRIFDWIANGSGSAIMKAVAGSGKTTTCINGLAFIPGIDLSQVRAGTFHSVGWSAILRKLGKSVDAKLERNKVRMIVRSMLDTAQLTTGLTASDQTLDDLYGNFVTKLISFAKGEGFGAIRAADYKDWETLIAHHDLYLESENASEEQAIGYARDGLRASNEAAKNGIFDYDDQLYIPLLWKLKLWQNDWVIIDETQDTNAVRRALAKLALRPGGRLMAVGDERQGIYGFTGASHDAMTLVQQEFNCIELPLTVSYRCAKNIVKHAQEIVSYIEPFDGAPEGIVAHTALDEALKVLGPKDAILCRNTAPLIELAFKLIAKGIGCHVLGREIGTGLVNLITKQRAKGLDNLMAKLERYREREVAKFTAKGEEGKAEEVNDRIACIGFVANQLDEKSRTVPALITKLEGLFSNDNGVLSLSTMHKSKGREWDHVAIYRPDLNPSKWARQTWQQVQEQNLMYVARTRAKLWLGYIVEEI